ncbi:FecR domain-containing protein [Myxococcota bacterium]|nr:FecR domain-containing protein [Myxococcota bacterium]
MKTNKSFWAAFFIPLFVLLFNIMPTSAQAGDSIATLTSSSGGIWFQVKKADKVRPTQGQAIVAGTRISTDKTGQAQVTFTNGSILKVRPSSSLLLSGTKRHKKKKSSVLLFFGRVWSKVTKSTTGSRNFEVRTPNAVCGVRGTEFETAVAHDGSIKVRVDEGDVGVGEGEEDAQSVTAGREIEGNEEGVGKASEAAKKEKWAAWEKKKARRLNKNARSIVEAIKKKIHSRKDRLTALRAAQKTIITKRKKAEELARAGDKAALDEVRAYNGELAEIADEIADLADTAETQFGLVDHFADLVGDPRFKSLPRKYIEAEAASLRRIKKMFDEMVADGTDISMASMDNLLKDMSKGKRNSLKDESSAMDDLFGGDGMDMK